MRRIGWIGLGLFAAGCVAPGGVLGDPSEEPGAKGDVHGDMSAHFPGARWDRVAPADEGLEVTPLERAAGYADRVGSRCLLVVRHGRLVYEWYGQGTDAETRLGTWSVGKSITALVIALAVQEGLIGSFDDAVSQYVQDPAWGEDKSDITVRDLLSMTSGLGSDHVLGMDPRGVGISGYSINDAYWAVTAEDQSGTALEAPVGAPPGAQWRYGNRPVQVLEPLLRGATETDVVDFARRHLWEPIGMGGGTSWERDEVGHPTLYKSVHATCPDLARIGYLMLRRGRWADRQVIEGDLVDELLRPSQSLNRGYGLLWWLNGQSQVITSTNEGPFDRWHFPFAPDDLFFAKGIGNNFIDVIPSLDMVVVHARPSPQERLVPWEALDAGEDIEHRQILCRLLDRPCPEDPSAPPPPPEGMETIP